MKAVVFSGTSEGREIIEYLNDKKIFTTVCVATDYGKKVINDMSYVSFHIGRLEQNDIFEVIKDFDFVIDATHPYAEIITKNVQFVCEQNGIEYIRLLRDEIIRDDVIYVCNIDEAVHLLRNTNGNIFISTGSKEIYKYCDIENYKNRIAARVLPAEDSIRKCNELGLKNVIYKKGPFGYIENIQEFRKYNIKWLVTKSSGKNGGFNEKVNAAKELGINVIVIKRPIENNGLSINNVKDIIDKKINGKIKNKKSYKKFPMFIDIFDKNIVVIGGGKIAVRRINVLLSFGAKIKVIAPEIIADEYIKNSIEYIKKEFEPKDIDEAFMVIGATDNRAVNHNIYNLCMSKNIFCNIADCREECNFYFPAICLSDDLSVGIVSDGDKHILVKETAENIRKIISDYT